MLSVGSGYIRSQSVNTYYNNYFVSFSIIVRKYADDDLKTAENVSVSSKTRE